MVDANSIRQRLESIDLEVKQLATVQTAYNTARQATCDFCDVPEQQIGALEQSIEIGDSDLLSDDEDAPLSKGGVLKFIEPPEDEEENDAA